MKIRFDDFRQITRSRTMGIPVASTEDMEELALALLAPQFPSTRGIRLLGVTLSTLAPAVDRVPVQISRRSGRTGCSPSEL